MDVVRLVAEARARQPEPLRPRERHAAAAMAAVFVAGVGVLAAALPHGRPGRPLVELALVLAYAIAARTSFEIGDAVVYPTELIFVPMLFLAPLHLVPVLASAGLLLARAPDFLARHRHPDRWLLSPAASWHALATAAVIGLLAPGPPRLAHTGVYVLALAVDSAVGALNLAIGNRLMFGRALADSAKGVAWGAMVNALLAPIALVVALVSQRNPLAICALLPLFPLLRTFSRERTERFNAAVELQQTYRGTVMLLTDVVEADDDYTADHSRSVVELAAAVGRQLRLSHDEEQELEIVALLHDVGKIAIPKEILNKPAKLTDEEFELMKRHTIEGQALLERVGGRLARVGAVVRSCHERWDGRGYPDGLAGERIPLAARIVFCCDAYSAMTTDRPYRTALSPEAALEELARNAGTQFEPRVVAALTHVIGSNELETVETYSDAVRAVLASRDASPLTRPPVAGVPS